MGLHPILFAKKELSLAETSDFERYINEAMSLKKD
jgi:hypothetical protein